MVKSVELIGIQVPDFPKWWPSLKPWIQTAIDRSGDPDDTTDYIFAELLAMRMQLWIVYDGKEVKGCGVTSVMTRANNTKFCRIIYLGGGGCDWKDVIRQMKLWAKEQSCEFIEIEGRKGWQRVLGIKPRITKYIYQMEI